VKFSMILTTASRLEPMTDVDAARAEAADAEAAEGDDQSDRPYHHGDLPNALREAACEVISERGLGSFSLREVARRAGVSHTAPAHHFGDMHGLLTSLAVEGFELLTGGMQRALEGVDDPVERLVAIGEAYVDFAFAHPAHCDVMFREDIVHPENLDLAGAGLSAYGLLDQTVRDLLDAESLDVDIDVATALCWSMVQGLVTLSPKLNAACAMRGRPIAPPRDLIREFTYMLVNGLRSSTTG
jgi:AcrR family transcriptional regulator